MMMSGKHNIQNQEKKKKKELVTFKRERVLYVKTPEYTIVSSPNTDIRFFLNCNVSISDGGRYSFPANKLVGCN